MASINDNLFTILLSLVNSSKASQHFTSRLGVVQLGMSAAGITDLSFVDDTPAKMSCNRALQEAFLHWVDNFSRLSLSERWKYMHPSGTEFQKKVWFEVSKIPFGATASYQSIAAAIHHPQAFRALGTAVGANPISLLIPCHRVIQTSGTIGNYRWGRERKVALLDEEQRTGSDLRSLFV